jgi:hypothetical protein
MFIEVTAEPECSVGDGVCEKLVVVSHFIFAIKGYKNINDDH